MLYIMLSNVMGFGPNWVGFSQRKSCGTQPKHIPMGWGTPVNLIEWSGPFKTTKDSSAKGRGAEINVSKVFWTEMNRANASKQKETVCWHNAHFARTKWYEWSAHSTHPKLTLSNRRHHDLFNLLILSVPSKSSLSTIGGGIHPRHHQRIGGARLLLQQPRAGDYPWQDPGHATNSEAAQSEDSWTGGTIKVEEFVWN